MLKYLSIIALTIGCISVVNAQDDVRHNFTIDYGNWWGKTIDGNWNPPSTFRDAHNYHQSFSYQVAGEAAPRVVDTTVNWSHGLDGQGLWNGNRLALAGSSTEASTVTFTFSEAVSGITFSVYGLNSFTVLGEDNKAKTVGGSLEIQGVKNDTNIEDHWDVMNSQLDLEASGYGYYERTTTQNQNETRMLAVTINEPVTSLTLYFKSQSYNISQINFTAGGRMAIPEPSTYAAIIGLGIAGFVMLRRRKA